MFKIKKETWFLIIMLLSMLIWGGSWTSAKMISATTSSEVLIFYRFLISFLAFIPVIIITKQSLKITKAGFFQVLLGALFLVIYNMFFFNGLKVGLAGAGGVIVTTINPLFTFLISIILYKQKSTKKDLLGIMIGLIGGLLLMQVWTIGSGKLFQGGNAYFLLAAIAWAWLSIFSQKSKTNMSPLVFSFYIYGLSSIGNLFLAIPKGILEVFQFDESFWFNLLYISLGATTFATTAYFIAASRLGASKASSFTFLVPTSALFFSWLILKEIPNYITILGGIFALTAVYIINFKPKKPINKT